MRLRKPARKRDILGLAIKTLAVEDSIYCTDRTLSNIRDRLDVFFKVQSNKTYKTFQLRSEPNVQHIKRMA